MKMGSTDDSCTLQLVNYLTVPARSEIIVPVSVRNSGWHGLEHALIAPVPTLQSKYGILGARCIGRVSDSTTVFRMYNPSDNSVRLRKNMAVATLDKVSQGDIVSIPELPSETEPSSNPEVNLLQTANVTTEAEYIKHCTKSQVGI